jgi:hypothetical protein
MAWTPITGNASGELATAENPAVVITPGAGVAAGSPDPTGGIRPGGSPDAGPFYMGGKGKNVTPDTGEKNVTSPNVAYE